MKSKEIKLIEEINLENKNIKHDIDIVVDSTIATTIDFNPDRAPLTGFNSLYFVYIFININ